MEENSDLTIEQVNQLKSESDKWSKRTGIVGLFVFIIPFLIFVATFVSFDRVFTGNNDGIVGMIVGGFALFPIIVVALMITLIIFLIFMVKRRSAYRAAYKKFFSHRVLTELLKEYYYDHASGISKTDLSSVGMVRLGNRYRSEDYVSGRYKDVGFTQADILIQDEHTDSDGDTRTETYFNGRWMVFEFPRRFVAKLAVVGRRTQSSIYARGMEKFPTESVEFNKEFKVYMQDGVEMFYLLDPKMIETMQALAEKFAGRIFFLFVDKKLHIGLNNGFDSFEPPKHKKGDLDTVEEIERLSSEFNVVFDLIDALEINRKIFK